MLTGMEYVFNEDFLINCYFGSALFSYKKLPEYYPSMFDHFFYYIITVC